jgi:hypothetical protein
MTSSPSGKKVQMRSEVGGFGGSLKFPIMLLCSRVSVLDGVTIGFENLKKH